MDNIERPNTNFVVSANYLYRSGTMDDPAKWLMRSNSTPHRQATPVNTVVATGVRFDNSDQWEAGWGCANVALCDDAESPDKEPDIAGLTSIRFNGSYFVVPGTRGFIRSVDKLVLLPNGKMYAEGIIGSEDF